MEEEDFEEVTKDEWHKDDLKALTCQIKEQESILRLKRRWLMDLPLTKTEEKRVEELLPSNDKIMPESLLREDDVSYEDIRSSVEMGFRANNNRMEHHFTKEFEQAFKSCDFNDILSLLDGMTNKGLCSFIKILTGGTMKFEKTNWSMKRVIKELLRKVICDKNDISKKNLEELFVLLKDPQSFRASNMVLSTPETYHSAAMKVLDALGDLSLVALIAMQKKLRGVRGLIPTLEPLRYGSTRDKLIRKLRKRCMKRLEIGKVGDPAEPLTGALGVACLALKVLLNRPPAIDFRKFSPDVEALQNDITKAIWLLKEPKTVSLIELKKVQLLLDPNNELSVNKVRGRVRNLLIGFLFECSDMVNIPDYLIETLDIINRRPQRKRQPCRKYSSSEIHSSVREVTKEEIQKEVEYVLNVSAQAKEIVLDRLSELEFDEDFAHAYLEDYEESDALFISDEDEDEDEHAAEDIPDYFDFRSHISLGQTESIGETIPAGINSPTSSSETSGCSPLFSSDGRLNIPKMHPDCFGSPTFKESKVLDSKDMNRPQNSSGHIAHKSAKKRNLSSLSHSHDRNSKQDDVKSEEPKSCSDAAPASVFSNFPVEQTYPVSQQSRFGNQYLEVQEACDVTSMTAYRVVGRMLDELAKIEGLELYQGDRLYLRSSTSVPEYSEESPRTLLANLSGIWKDVLEN